MKKTLTIILFSVIAAMVFYSCDVLSPDGADSESISQRGGYFYMLDRTTVSLVMMDHQLRELQRWNLYPITNDTSLQGITFDGKNLWITSSGSALRIFQLDIQGTSITASKTFDAPPSRRGTVRDIAFDGGSFWVANSGSRTYSIPAMLYKLDPLTGATLDSVFLPFSEPRAVGFIPSFLDVYGRGNSDPMLYISDGSTSKIYKYNIAKPALDTAFSAPVPPRGTSYVNVVGLTGDGQSIWLVNGSTTTPADHLYRINYFGRVDIRYDLPYALPGPIVWAASDVRAVVTAPLTLLSVSPVSARRDTSIVVDLFGTGFKSGAGLAVSFGAGITTDSVRFVSTTQLSAGITVAANASLGKRNVTVTNTDGNSVTKDSIFEVTAQTQGPGFLWLADQNSVMIYKIRISDTTIVASYSTAGLSSAGPQGVAFDGTNLWLCISSTTRRLYKIDTTGGAISELSSFTAPANGGTLRGIVFEAGFLWMSVSNPSMIYKINPATGLAVDSITSPGNEPRGITFSGGAMYCNDTTIDSVFSYNTTAGTWTSRFATPTPAGGSTTNRFATGLTWDGSNFWIANSSGNYDHVYKLTPSGDPLLAFPGPNLGPAQLTGLTHTPN
jgi:streptogramin lyase